MIEPSLSPSAWPELPYGAWADTCTTLHLWTQIVGKVRLSKSTWVNHFWQVTLDLAQNRRSYHQVPYKYQLVDLWPGTRLRRQAAARGKRLARSSSKVP